MVMILHLWYIQNGAPKLLLMAQPLKHLQSESGWGFVGRGGGQKRHLTCEIPAVAIPVWFVSDHQGEIYLEMAEWAETALAGVSRLSV